MNIIYGYNKIEFTTISILFDLSSNNQLGTFEFCWKQRIRNHVICK